MQEDILVEVNNVSKKFCKNLKRSLWYGAKELAADFMGVAQNKSELRKDEFWAVKDVSFQLRRGECMGLIGHNGAGKSTLLKMLNGLIRPDEGEIRMRGRVGALIELGAGFNPVLTGRENVYVNGQILGFSKKEIDQKFEAIVAFAEIADFIDSPVQNYSSGMKVRLGFAVAAQMEPDILIIDEVLAVGDVGFRMKCYNTILKLKERGTCIILVTHSMIDINRLCSEGIVLNKGRIELQSANISRVISTYEVLAAYKEDVESIEEKTALVANIETFSEAKEPRKDFTTGDSIYVKATIKNTLKRLENCRLMIHIESPSLGHLGSFSSPYQNVYFDFEIGITEVWFELIDIPLLQGGYFIDVALKGTTIEEHYHWNRQQCIFNITAPQTETFGFGLAHNVFFKHKWFKE